MRLNLRAKGILAFLALMSYVVVVGAILGAERQTLQNIAIALEQFSVQESALAKSEYAIDHSRLRLQTILQAESLATSSADDVAMDAELIHAGLTALLTFDRRLEKDVLHLNDRIKAIRHERSRSALGGYQDMLFDVEARLGDMGVRLREHRKAKWDEYYTVYDRMTVIAISTMVIAAVVFGGLVSMFFSRIAWDLGRLEARALDIVAGYRDAPLPVTRDDEIGGLMSAVNRMQSEIREHERQLELVRQQRFHQEKMAAVGSLAAAVAHEINNPIAAIAGIAQSMAASGATESRSGDFEGDGPLLILDQTQRISAISRQIAEFTRPRSPSPELIDLNRLVKGVCKFTGYDRRLHTVELTVDADPDLPAVECIADHVTQVLMNLLINAGDALDGLAGRKPEIRVLTRRAGDHVTLAVQDNGRGMGATTRERAFDEGFSTKVERQGLGLGLFLCKALVEGDGGGIEITSSSGDGTVVTVRLPLRPAGVA